MYRWLGGSISLSGRLVHGLPHRIEVAAHDRRSNGYQPLDTGATPAHTRTIEACPETLATALDHATPDGEALFAQFLILQAGLIVLKVTGFAAQPLGHGGMRVGRLPQAGRNLFRMAFKQKRRLGFAPVLGGGSALALQQVGGVGEVLRRMIPVPGLSRCASQSRSPNSSGQPRCAT